MGSKFSSLHWFSVLTFKFFSRWAHQKFFRQPKSPSPEITIGKKKKGKNIKFYYMFCFGRPTKIKISVFFYFEKCSEAREPSYRIKRVCCFRFSDDFFCISKQQGGYGRRSNRRMCEWVPQRERVYPKRRRTSTLLQQQQRLLSPTRHSQSHPVIFPPSLPLLVFQFR